ncbi:Autophagy protein 22, partial [Ascosphaera pollenicola]
MDAEAGGGGRRAPRFEGEDTTPTTKLELRGWYTYGVAAEVFAVCGVGSFLPLTLEQLAREHGVLYSDRSLSCVEPRPSVNNATVATSAAVNGTVRAAKYLARAIEDVDPDRCVVHVFGKELNTASFAMFTFSAAVFFQALTLVSSSSLADHGNNRKRLLAAFGYCGAISSMLFLFLPASGFVIAPILVIMGVVCLGCSFVVLNSFLPLLVANHPENVQSGPGFTHSRSDSELELDARFGGSGCHDDLSSSRMHEAKSNKSSAPDQLSTEISSKGTGLGYVAAVFMQIVSILVLVLLSKTAVAKAAKSLPMRIVLFNVGVWWAAGTHLAIVT